MQNHRKIKQPHKSRPTALSSTALLILCSGLPIILFYLLAFLSLILDRSDIPTYILARKYAYTLEHIIMSATLIVGGALLIDLVEKELKNQTER